MSASLIAHGKSHSPVAILCYLKARKAPASLNPQADVPLDSSRYTFIRWEIVTILIVLAIRTIFCLYRAQTQSITIDEATTFLSYVNGDWSSWYRPFDANNHVLYTLVAKALVALCGPSELVLRLPSVVSGLAILMGFYNFMLLWPIRSALVKVVSVVGLAIHPMLLDFSVAARGYSMSLALLVWACVAMIRRRRIAFPVLLALAVCANLSSAFPAAAIAACAAFDGTATWKDRVAEALRIGFLAVTTAGAILWLPLSTATKDSFYVGYDSLAESASAVVSSAVRARPDYWGFFQFLEGPRFIATIVLPLLLLGSVFGLLAYRSRIRRIDLVIIFIPPITLALVVGAHHLGGVKYPVERTSLYCAVFGAVISAKIADLGSRAIRTTYVICVFLLVAQMTTQLQSTYFYFWMFDRSTKAIARTLRDRTSALAPGSVQVTTTWLLQPSLDFYRVVWAMDRIKPLAQDDGEQVTDADYYVLTDDDLPSLAKKQPATTMLFRDPLARVTLVKVGSR